MNDKSKNPMRAKRKLEPIKGIGKPGQQDNSS